MLKKSKKTKKGAASFYIVAFSTLILVIVATSFAMVILSEMSRSMNDDLAQSAYDSALAGVEDAKIAFANYQRCLENETPVPTTLSPTTTGCDKIMWYMANPRCNMVAEMLYDIDGEVTVGGVDTGSGTSTNQAYTCVKILTELSDYRSSLGKKTGNYVQTIKAGVADTGLNTVERIRFSWYSVNKTNSSRLLWNSAGGKFTSSASVPPIIEMQIVQTGTSFSMSDFDITQGDKTNRATLYLMPSNAAGSTFISKGQVAETNDHNATNKPFTVSCNDSGEFYCSVDIELPDAINTTRGRANETFLISVSIPYQEPDTDFSLELICPTTSANNCGNAVRGTTATGSDSEIVKIKNTQVAIESTGRANDLYRRVETRLESSDTTFGMGKESPFYALMILGSGGVNKNMTVRFEPNYPFYF